MGQRVSAKRNASDAGGDDTWRAFGNRHVGWLVTKAIAAPARRRGFTEITLLREWHRVVGPALAQRCQPVRVRIRPGRGAGSVLELRAYGGAALEIQHAAPQIIERVNQYFGERAVRQIKIIQAPLPRPLAATQAVSERALREDERLWIANEVKSIEHDGLRASLTALGEAIKRADRS